jgi:lipoprotein NlpI
VWPRLGNSFNLGTITSAQSEELRKELAAMDDRVRKNELKLVTREQVSAQVKLALLSKQLAAGRLPDKLRAEALVAQGIQFDHLGRLREGRQAFDQALALDKTNAEVYAAMAVNALWQRQDQEAVVFANRALEMAPANTAPRYTRAWARYFTGDAGQARDDLLDILKSRTEVERSYGAIWLYLATRRAGGDGERALGAYLPNGSKPGWPYPVLQWLAGQSSLEAAVAGTWDGDKPDRGRECELYFFAAQKALLDNDLKLARSHLQKSLASGVVEFTEYAMSQRELDRIGKP